MPSSVKELLAAANASVPKISPQEAAGLLGDANVLVVDVRDGTELQSVGKTLQDLGYKDVRNLGGFKDWVESGGAVEKV
jgi:rhodanese-related sulfurtransferase